MSRLGYIGIGLTATYWALVAAVASGAGALGRRDPGSYVWILGGVAHLLIAVVMLARRERWPMWVNVLLAVVWTNLAVIIALVILANAWQSVGISY